MQSVLNLVPLAWACLLIAGLTSAADWSYGDGDHGPDHWKDDYEKCGGSSQSPINLDTYKVEYDDELTAFTFTGYETPTANAKPVLKNNGHTVQVDLTDGEYTISNAKLPGTYKAAQFHFHWGSDNSKGSEHQVDSKKYPLEMHIVHYAADTYADLTTAADKDEGLAVLGILFEVEGSDNSVFNEIVNHLSNVSHKGDSVDLENFALEPLLPSDTSKYFRYPGGLTTPGCYESVIWTVFQSTVKISQSQMDKFRAVFENEDGVQNKAMVNNYRPVQAVNDRVVKTSNDNLPNKGSSGPFVSMALMLSAISMLHYHF